MRSFEFQVGEVTDKSMRRLVIDLDAIVVLEERDDEGRQ